MPDSLLHGFARQSEVVVKMGVAAVVSQDNRVGAGLPPRRYDELVSGKKAGKTQQEKYCDRGDRGEAHYSVSVVVRACSNEG